MNDAIHDDVFFPETPGVDVAAFLAALDDRLLDLHKPLDVIDATVSMIGRYLRVNRVGYVEIEHDADMIHYAVGWGDGVLEPLSGRQSIVEQLGEKYMAHYHAGRTSYARDTDDDSLAIPGTLSAVGAKAMMAVPLVRDGVWVAGLFVNQAEIRDWLPEEGALLEGAVRRLWDKVERARLEFSLTERNLEREVFWDLSWDLLGIAGGDGIWDAANPAWTRTLGWETCDIIGRSLDWMEHSEGESFASKIGKLSPTAPTTSFSHHLRTSSGDIRHFEWKVRLQDSRVYAVARLTRAAS